MKSRRRVKRLLFSLLPLIVLLIAVTVILQSLEHFQVIDTERPDDWIDNAPLHYIFAENNETGTQIRIQHMSMVVSRFLKTKPAGALRMFVSGGSFALGTPAVDQNVDREISGGISEWMRDDLRLRYPREKIEIINVAAGGGSSFRVVETIQDIMPFSPDIVFIIAGNNDGFSSVININRVLQKWVTYRALKRQFLADPTMEERMAAEMGREVNENIIAAFMGNMKRIVDLAEDYGVKVLLATMPINLRPTLRVMPKDIYQQGMSDAESRAGEQLFARGEYRRAIEYFNASQAMILATYRLAECYEQLGDFQRADYFYHFNHKIFQGIRASFEVNEMIRRLAAEKEHVYLVDLEKYACEISPHNLPGDNLYVDICHMHHTGYYQMAQEALRVLKENNLIPAAFGEPSPKPTMQQIIDHYGWTFPDDFPEHER